MDGLLTVKNLVKYFDISGGLLEQLTWENWRVVGGGATGEGGEGVRLAQIEVGC